MRLVEGTLRQDLLMDGAGGNEYEPADSRGTCGLDQLQCPEDVLVGELDDVAFAAAEAPAWMVESGVHDGVAAFNQCFGCRSVP
jgi:hypothetical protein